jgi:hypothetical protein
MNSTLDNKPTVNVVGVKLKLNWLLLRFFVALILLVAAGLKAYQLSTTPMIGVGIFHSRWFNVFVVEFEIFFSLWLVFGFLPKLTRLAAIGCFLIFTIVSLFKALLGELSCGCFGLISVDPWVTATFDCFVVVLLVWFCWCANSKEKADGFLVLNFIISWLLVSLFVSWGMVTYKPALFNAEGKVVGGSSSVILYPQDWLGKRLPLLEYIDSPKDVGVGNWTLFFYGVNCVKCERHFADLQKQNEFQKNSGSDIVCLEVGGSPQNALRNRFDNGTWYWGNLKSTKRWFVDTPTILKIEDGNVKSVSSK